MDDWHIRALQNERLFNAISHMFEVVRRNRAPQGNAHEKVSKRLPRHRVELIPVPEPPPLARSGQQTNQRVTFVLFSLRLRDFQS